MGSKVLLYRALLIPPTAINGTFTRCYYTVSSGSEPTRAAAATPRGGQYKAIRHTNYFCKQHTLRTYAEQ
jgi:hypothetical protein